MSRPYAREAAVGSFIYFEAIGNWVLPFLLLFMASFSISWGPIVWVLLSEIFPNKIRSLALAISVFIQWVANFVVTQVFPSLIENQWLFLLLIIIAALGFAAVLSLTNAISSKASFNNTLMPILSLPVLIPFFIILVAQTNHLIGNKEYHDFSFAQAREGSEVEVLCSSISFSKNIENMNCGEYSAVDSKGKKSSVVFCGHLSTENNQPLILKGKTEKEVFYASNIWNKATVSSSSNIKYYGALTLLTTIVLVIGQFLFPKIAKF